MSLHFADRLLEACREKESPICVGLDPVFDRLPESLRGDDPVAAIETFCQGVIESIADTAPCVKLQSACFERYLTAGHDVYLRITAMARERGLVVIGDAKRGDIGISAAHYAAGCLDDHDGSPGPDALTINAYFGKDGIDPFVQVAAEKGKGLFALVRTSNPGGDALQSQQLADGRSVADCVAQIVADIGSNDVGESGYSLLGAVVGATKPQDAARLRELMSQQIFLVPGFGAQGGGADDVRACFKSDGTGAIITASRSVIYAFAKSDSADWKSAIRDAAIDMKQQVNAILAG